MATFYLPDYRPQDFVGRSAYLAQLHAALTVDPSAILLCGEPGAGKSTLALRFAWDAQKDFDADVFHTCGQRELGEIGSALADCLPIYTNLPPDQKHEAAKTWLRQRQSLLLLDDLFAHLIMDSRGEKTVEDQLFYWKHGYWPTSYSSDRRLHPAGTVRNDMAGSLLRLPR